MLEADEVLLIGRMITKVLDHQSNLPSLSRSGSWRSQTVELSLAKSSSSQLRRLSRNLVAWIYEQLKRNDNQAPNFIVYYTLVGVLLAENTDRSELSIQLLKVFLAIQVSLISYFNPLNEHLRITIELMMSSKIHSSVRLTPVLVLFSVL